MTLIDDRAHAHPLPAVGAVRPPLSLRADDRVWHDGTGAWLRLLADAHRHGGWAYLEVELPGGRTDIYALPWNGHAYSRTRAEYVDALHDELLADVAGD